MHVNGEAPREAARKPRPLAHRRVGDPRIPTALCRRGRAGAPVQPATRDIGGRHGLAPKASFDATRGVEVELYDRSRAANGGRVVDETDGIERVTLVGAQIRKKHASCRAERTQKADGNQPSLRQRHSP